MVFSKTHKKMFGLKVKIALTLIFIPFGKFFHSFPRLDFIGRDKKTAPKEIRNG